MNKECKYGTHRVLEPKGSLPQAALVLCNEMICGKTELLIDVITLNIDSASYTQIKQECKADEQKMKDMICDIVAKRGKMQNPVTGSGGMLIGTIKQVGKDFPDKSLKVGDKIATLVSLSLTPLKIEEILYLSKDSDQVDIKGQAILFESGLYAVLPKDMPEKLSLAALDVAGAPAQVRKLVKEGDIVCIIGGGGKSGLLCAAEAMSSKGKDGKVIVVEYSKENAQRILELGLADIVIEADATKIMDVYERVMNVVGERGCDVVINNVNVPSTEMSSILITKDEGVVYFFSMATNFAKAALGAEGVGKDVTLMMGNGYTKGHADLTLDLLRKNKALRECFEKLYA